MSDRERWIVYPLLLLTLGVVMRDKLFRTIQTDHIMCRDIVLVDGDNKPVMLVGGLYRGGGLSSSAPVISVIGPNDQLTAQLGSTVQCGNVVASGLIRANSLVATNLTKSKNLVANVVQSPTVLILDPSGKPAVQLSRDSFRNLQKSPQKAPGTKMAPEQPGPKQKLPEHGAPPEPAVEE